MAKAKRKIITEEFPSIDAFLRTIEGRKVNSVYKHETLSSQKVSPGGSWNGTETYAEAVDLITHGWAEPLNLIKKEMNKTPIKANGGSKARPSTGIVGYAPCVPNAIVGLPNSMIATERVPMKAKIITLLYGVTAGASTKEEEFIRSGVAVMRIVNRLEAKGYRVKLAIDAYSAESYNGEQLSLVLKLKDWRQPLDLKKLAFPMVHPSMLRRLGFKWIETQPELTCSTWPMGYGIPINNRGYKGAKDFFVEAKVLNTKDCYYINIALTKECSYDIDQIMSKCGMGGK